MQNKFDDSIPCKWTAADRSTEMHLPVPRSPYLPHGYLLLADLHWSLLDIPFLGFTLFYEYRNFFCKFVHTKGTFHTSQMKPNNGQHILALKKFKLLIEFS